MLFLIKEGNDEVYNKRSGAQDAEDLIEYYNKIAGETDYLNFGKNEFLSSREEEENHILKIKNNKKGIILVCLREEKIIGVLQIITYSRKRFSHNTDLSISVSKDFWNKGVGSSLIKEDLKHSYNKGIKNVFLGAREDNARAINLYRKFYFEIVGCNKKFFYLNGKFYDEILMKKEIRVNSY